jgi:hypothetical protein
MEYNKTTKTTNLLSTTMKVLTIYLLSLCFFASVGSQLANNIKDNLQEHTNRFDSALTSYSRYLQGN